MNRRGFISTLTAGVATLMGRETFQGAEKFKTLSFPPDNFTSVDLPAGWLHQEFMAGKLSVNDVRKKLYLEPIEDDLDSFYTHGLYPIEPRSEGFVMTQKVREEYLEESRIRASVNLPPLPYLVEVRPAALHIYSDGSQEIKTLDDYRRGCGCASCIKEIGT